MEKLVFINACIRREHSRTLAVARALLKALNSRYEITEIDLTDVTLAPVTAADFHRRGTEGLSAQDKEWGRLVAEADRLMIAAPFWDMSFPAVLKSFFEHISFPDLTFANNEDGTTHRICRAEKVLYVTTRGMEIATDSPLDQGTPHIRAISWLWGLGTVHTVAAYGMDIHTEDVVAQRLDAAIQQGLAICEEF